MTIRNLKWLSGGPRRLDIDHPLLVVATVGLDTYPELFDLGGERGALVTTGAGLTEGHYLAADDVVLEEPEIGVIFRDCIPEVAGEISNKFRNPDGIPPVVMITGEVVRGTFLVQDIIVAGERLIREELREVLNMYNLESLDDQFLGYH